MIEEAIVELLADLAAVYPAYLPERTPRPAIVYRRISTTSVLTHDGPSDLLEARFQISAHAETHPEALTIARTIRARLNGTSPSTVLATVDLVTIENELDLGFTPDALGWEITLDAIFRYKE
jgi:hypothetical protein